VIVSPCASNVRFKVEQFIFPLYPFLKKNNYIVASGIIIFLAGANEGITIIPFNAEIIAMIRVNKTYAFSTAPKK
jgi:hypothetical protein